MDKKPLGAFAVVATWLFVVYLIVAMLVFWSALQKDWQNLSVRVVFRDLLRSLLWIREMF